MWFQVVADSDRAAPQLDQALLDARAIRCGPPLVASVERTSLTKTRLASPHSSSPALRRHEVATAAWIALAARDPDARGGLARRLRARPDHEPPDDEFAPLAIGSDGWARGDGVDLIPRRYRFAASTRIPARRGTSDSVRCTCCHDGCSSDSSTSCRCPGSRCRHSCSGRSAGAAVRADPAELRRLQRLGLRRDDVEGARGAGGVIGLRCSRRSHRCRRRTAVRRRSKTLERAV